MPNTVRGFFAQQKPNWQLPQSGMLYEGPSGVYTIFAVNRLGTWNELRDSLGAVDWELDVACPDGSFKRLRAAKVALSRYIIEDDYLSPYEVLRE